MRTKIGVDCVNNGLDPNNKLVEQPSVQPNVNNTTVPVDSVSNPINGGTSQGASNQPGVQQTQNTYVQNAPQVNTASNNSNMENLNMQSMKEVTIDTNPPKKGKYVILVLFFIALLLMIWFLPEISSYIEIMKAKKQQGVETITTGVLKCELERSSDNYDLSYQQDFSFEDSKLTKLSYVEQTRGDMISDAADLDAMNLECENLSTMVKSLDGVLVSCDLNDGTMTKKQTFDFNSLDLETVTAAFTEVGSIYPNYEKGQSIDTIEKNMKASGYSCERIK